VPDTYAVVTSLSRNASGTAAAGRGAVVARNSSSRNLASTGGGYVWGRTEVLERRTSPQWTKVVYLDYEPGTQLLFYVHVFAAAASTETKATAESSSSSDEDESGKNTGSNNDGNQQFDYSSSLGAALFEVGDILSTQHCTRVKRLRGGGVIFCRLERTKRTALRRRFRFRLGARDLVLPGNKTNYKKLRATVELAKFATNGNRPGTWITTYRSNAADAVVTHSDHGRGFSTWPSSVSEASTSGAAAPSSSSSSPPPPRSFGGGTSVATESSAAADAGSRCILTWDAADMDLGTLCNGDVDNPIRVTVLQAKAGGIAAAAKHQHVVIGMAETNLRNLLRIGSEARAMRRQDPDNGGGEERAPTIAGDASVDGDRSTSFGDDALRPNELYLQRSLDKLKKVGRLRVIDAEVVSPEDEDATASSVLEAGAEGGVADDSNSELRWSNANRGIPEACDETIEVVDLAKLQPVAPPSIVVATAVAPVPTKTFQQYVDQGCELEFCVAIDFTSSNGDPRLERSLHYQCEDTYNDYEETILAVGKAIDAYSKTQEHVVWGFGAKFGGNVRHLFQCGSDPTVKGVDGILSAYQSVFHSDLIMSGPTILMQVIQAAAVKSKRLHDQMTPNSLRYNVLLIVTDGLADEFEETRRKLAVYSEMPLSVVIVGVGRSSDFRTMYQLSYPSASGGAGRTRRNTSFVEFRKHQYDPAALGQAALRDIPAQLCEYMARRGF